MRDLKISTLNICSLRRKIDDLERVLHEEEIDIICVTETWLDDSINDGEIEIPGYCVHRRDRLGRRGGGVCIYATNDIPVNPRSDLESNNVEAVWIEVQGKESVLVGCLYRPPHETLQFWDDIDELLSQPAIGRHKIILAGDLRWLAPVSKKLMSILKLCLEVDIDPTTENM